MHTQLTTLLAVPLAASAACAQPRLVNIGVPPGATSSEIMDISADGRAAVVHASTGGFVWREATGLHPLPTLPEHPSSIPRAINASGDFLAGSSHSPVHLHGITRAVRWTPQGVEPLLAQWSGAAEYATAISENGQNIAGSVNSACCPSNGQGIFRWNAATGYEHLGTLPGVHLSWPTVISDDGESIIGGRSHRSINVTTSSIPWRWTPATGFTSMDLPPGTMAASAHGMSRDGTLIAGVAYPSSNILRAVIWDCTAAPVCTPITLPMQPGWTHTQADTVERTPDGGALAVGIAIHAPGVVRAAAWRLEHGQWHPLDVGEMLASPPYNIDTTGWIFSDAATLGAHASVIGGTGTFHGERRGWIAYLTPACYPNCDNSAVPPILNVDDFTCFINEFASASALPHAQQLTHYANCDSSTTAPVLTIDDFTCFIDQFAQGCP